MNRVALRALLPITRFHDFHRDPNINYQLNRLLIPGLEGLFVQLGKRIVDFTDWKREFFEVASAREQSGELASAATLYRAAEFFISPDDPDRRRAYEKFMDLFGQANANAGLEVIEIPYEHGSLHGLRIRAPSSSHGMVLMHAGYDAYAEEFLGLAKAVSACGYEVIMFDGPGQGSTLMRNRIPMTPAWEKPIAAVLDHCALNDVTLIGISLGGCLALRAAAREPRVKRVIAFDVMLDFFDCVTSRRGKASQFLLSALLRLNLTPLLNAIAYLMMRRDLYSRWGIDQGMHVMGCKTPAAFFAALRDYETRTVSPLITQDVLIMAGAEDHFVPLEQFFGQLPLLVNARSVTGQIYTREDEAQAHCQIGNLSVAVEQMTTWIATHSNPPETKRGQ